MHARSRASSLSPATRSSRSRAWNAAIAASSSSSVIASAESPIARRGASTDLTVARSLPLEGDGRIRGRRDNPKPRITNRCDHRVGHCTPNSTGPVCGGIKISAPHEAHQYVRWPIAPDGRAAVSHEQGIQPTTTRFGPSRCPSGHVFGARSYDPMPAIFAHTFEHS